MAWIQTRRPGVYSTYTTVPLYTNLNSTAAAGVVAQGAQAVEGVLEISSSASLQEQLPQESTLRTMVQLLLQAGVGKVLAVSLAPEAALSQYQEGFSRLQDRSDLQGIACDSSDLQVMQALKEHVNTCSEHQKERLAFFGAAADQAASLAQSLNSERCILVSPACAVTAQGPSHGGFSAAAALGQVLTLQAANNSLNGSVLTGISALEKPLTEEAVERLLGAGVWCLEAMGNSVETIRGVTTRTRTGEVSDGTFLSVNTILIIDQVMKTLRTMLQERLKGHGNNAVTRESVASQVTVELGRMVEQGLLSSYQKPVVYVSDQDSGILVVELAFAIAHVIDQIYITAQIQV